MLDKDKMRKADVYSGAGVFLFGLWIVSQAVQMPMKDSWGGVMNVWYVSPALMPLFVGGMVMLLGLMLVQIALRSIGLAAFKATLRWLAGPELRRLLADDATLRFYAIATLFLALVFVNLPRVDFFVAATIFLTAFITMFYFYDDALMRRLFVFYLAGQGLMAAWFVLGGHRAGDRLPPFATDLLGLLFLAAYTLRAWGLVRRDPERRRKFRLALVVAFATPLVVGVIFKYFLMVPLPEEGLVVAGLDYLWYYEF